MQFHQLKRKTKLKSPKRVGRGGKRGKTSGRGTKGQKARAGRKLRPEARDIIKKIPKKRGYAFNSIQPETITFNLSVLDKAFASGDEVNPKTLIEKGLVKEKNSGMRIKILSNGEITKKINVVGCLYSASAKEKIEKAGGVVK